MMEISAGLVKAAAMVGAIGTISGGAFVLDSRHAPYSVVSDMRVGGIFDLVEIAQRDGPSDWICRAIEEEIIKLCSDEPDHYLCRDHEAMENIKDKAECD